MKKYSFLLSASLILFACGSKVKTIHPERKDITEMVFASGILEAEDQYNLTAQTDGYITKMNFKEGDIVAEGQLMVVIDNSQNIVNATNSEALHQIAADNVSEKSPQLQQIEANLQAAMKKAEEDKTQAQRYGRLYAQRSVSKLELENAQLAANTSQANVDALHHQYEALKVNARQQEITQRNNSRLSAIVKDQNNVRSLSNARVYERRKQLGDYVRKGDVIAVLGNPKLIYAKVNVDETSMNKVKEGQACIIRLNTNKEKIYHASVQQLLPKFDQSSLSYIVKLYFTDSLDFPLVGTQLEANIIAGERKQVLIIPKSYLDYGNKVTLAKDKKQLVIKTGLLSNDYIEVIEGLTESDELIENLK